MGQFLLIIIKLLTAIFLIPIAYSSSIAFTEYLTTFPFTYKLNFFVGLFSFLISYLFLYQFWGVYESGQKIIGNLFKFTAPLDRFIANLVPFYLFLTLIAYYIITKFLNASISNNIFLFLTGFTFAMHIILSAQDMQNDEKTPIKPTYLYKICLIYIINLCVMVLVLGLIFNKFAFPNFYNSTYLQAKQIYSDTYRKIVYFK